MGNFIDCISIGAINYQETTTAIMTS